jgi:hypothetical protein
VKTVLFVLVSLCLSTLSFADDLNVSITDPSTWSDGSVVSSGDIAKYDISYDCGGVAGQVLTDNPTHTFNNVPAGSCDVMAKVIDANGVVSTASNMVTVTTGVTLNAPTTAVVVDTGTTLQQVIDACINSPSANCVVIP